MKTVLLPASGGRVRLTPHPTYAVAAGTARRPSTCPGCSAAPLRVQGRDRTIGGHDYYRADGFCADCGARVGEIRAYVSTIFGLDEDERVLVHGRPRVY